jgi:glycosyltransferase involved in cell wall biosynthesis
MGTNPRKRPSALVEHAPVLRAGAPRAQVTTAICTYDRYDMLAESIASVRSQQLPRGSGRILVVDNSPDPHRAREFAEQYGECANLEFVFEPRPGIANARNVALAACETELLAFIDDDAVAHPGWLAALVKAFDEGGEDVAVVGGRVVPRWGAPRPPWLHESAFAYLSLIDLGPERQTIERRQWLAGANLAFRVDTLRAAGGFANHLGRNGAQGGLLSNEETDAIRRIQDQGARAVYEPAASVDHFIPPERLEQSWFRRRAAWQAISDYASDPEPAKREWLATARRVDRFFNRLPPGERTLAALARDVATPGDFRRQLDAIRTHTGLLISGAEPPRFPQPRPWWGLHRRLRHRLRGR